MRDWRKALQSKSMRNATLAIFVVNAVGIYAAQVRIDQPVADELDAGDVTPAIADRDIGSGLAPLPSPQHAARAPIAMPVARLAIATPHFIPDAQTQALDTQPSEPEFAAVVRKATPQPARVASIDRRVIAGDTSASFTAAFSGMDVGASAAATDPGVSASPVLTGLPTSAQTEPAVLDPASSQPPAIGAAPLGQGSSELPPIDDHAGTTGGVSAAAPDAPISPAPADSGADAQPVVLGA